MVEKLRVWIFLLLALVLMGLALTPVLRVAVGVDTEFSIQFFTFVMLLIGGLMSGLTAMILMLRRQPKLDWSSSTNTDQTGQRLAIAMHSTGLLIYSGIPLFNFLVCYWLWVANRHKNQNIDQTGFEVLNYQITMYLYLMLSLFMIFAGIGLLTTPLLLGIHLLCTLTAIGYALNGRSFKYPLNIPVFQGRPGAISGQRD